MLESSKPSVGRLDPFRRLFGRLAGPVRHPRPVVTRLGLERLEEREVPAVFMVTNLSDAGPGSLRAAIAQVNSLPPTPVRPVIEFAPNLAHQTINLTTVGFNTGQPGSSSAFEIVNPVTILGTGETINRVGTADAFRLFFVESSGDLELDNLTLSGGRTVGDNNVGGEGAGGAILSNAGRVYVSGCTFTNNQAVGGDNQDPLNGDGGYAYGGAIANLNGKLSLVNSTLTGNVAAGGQAGPGGGLTGTAEGGAVFTTGSDGFVSIVHCTIAENVVSGDISSLQASNGGAVYTYRGRVDAINSIFSGTFDGRNDVCNNTGTFVATGVNVIPTEVYTFHGGTSDTTGVVTADPMLGPLQDNGGPTQTMALLPGSPALAQVPVYGAVTTDQRGAARGPGLTDVGAYEVQNPLSAVGVPADARTLFGPQPNASADIAFVRGLYQATLLRAGEDAGVNYWVGRLNAGVGRADVAQGFYNSSENRGNQVKFFYRYFLGREGSPGEVQGWVNVLQAGVDEAVVMQGFLLSQEYTASNSNAQFVSTMYYAILGRPGDAAGFAGWQNALDTNQLTRDKVAQSFIRSTEAVTRVVANDYAVYLKREASPSDVDFWLGQVQSGLSFGAVATACLGSQEFYNAAAANVP